MTDYSKMWISKNVPIRDSYQQVGMDVVMLSPAEIDSAYHRDDLFEMLCGGYKAQNPESAQMPDAFAIWTNNGSEGGLILTQIRAVSPKKIHVTLVKGLVKKVAEK